MRYLFQHILRTCSSKECQAIPIPRGQQAFSWCATQRDRKSIPIKTLHLRQSFLCSQWRGLFGRGGGNATQQTLEDIAKGIKENEYKRVVVMAGAGISTPSGIPDFRSPGSGLYDNLQQYNLPYAEAIFEINYFHHNPKPFFTLAKELYPGNYQPNLTHYFIRLLQDKGQLLRMYTQNIDGLERIAGIPPKKLVEAHGTFATATCTVCRRNYKGEEFYEDVMKGSIPKCPTCTGVVKPDIVFFGEELPQNFFMYLTDFPMADLLIIMGTSLEVEPFASLAGAVRASVPRLLINRDLVGPFAWGSPRHNDVAQLGDVVSGVSKLACALGWQDDLQALMASKSKKSEEWDGYCWSEFCADHRDEQSESTKRHLPKLRILLLSLILDLVRCESGEGAMIPNYSLYSQHSWPYSYVAQLCCGGLQCLLYGVKADFAINLACQTLVDTRQGSFLCSAFHTLFNSMQYKQVIFFCAGTLQFKVINLPHIVCIEVCIENQRHWMRTSSITKSQKYLRFHWMLWHISVVIDLCWLFNPDSWLLLPTDNLLVCHVKKLIYAKMSEGIAKTTTRLLFVFLSHLPSSHNTLYKFIWGLMHCPGKLYHHGITSGHQFHKYFILDSKVCSMPAEAMIKFTSGLILDITCSLRVLTAYILLKHNR